MKKAIKVVKYDTESESQCSESSNSDVTMEDESQFDKKINYLDEKNHVVKDHDDYDGIETMMIRITIMMIAMMAT